MIVLAALLKKLSIKFLKEFATTPSVAKSITIIATNALIATAAIITDPYCLKISFIQFTSFFLICFQVDWLLLLACDCTCCSVKEAVD